MRIKYDFELMEMEDKTIAIPVNKGTNGFHGVIKFNDSALEIFNLIKDGFSEAEIVSKLAELYGDDPNDVSISVRTFIEGLYKEGVLE